MKNILKTERLILRPLEDSDIKDVYETLVAHPELPYYMTFDVPKSIEETQIWHEEAREQQKNRDIARWGIFLEERFIGVISLEGTKRIVRKWKMNKSEMGYWLNPEFHGKGYVPEAAKAVLEYGFTDFGLHKVRVGHVLENAASARVIEKLGFRKMGISKDHCYFDDRWWDDVRYEITVDQWNKL